MSDRDLFVKYPTGKIGKGKFCRSCMKYNTRQVCSHALVVSGGKLLMIKRGMNPMKGWWALPAGYLEWDETAEECALRELEEEAGLVGKEPKLLGVYTNPERDEDGRQNVAIVYVVAVEEGAKAKAGDDAAETGWFDLRELPERIAFDHRNIIFDYVASVKAKTKSEKTKGGL